MKTIRQINEIAHNWNEGSRDFAIRSLCDALIGITEHLEAQERPCDKRAIWGQVDPEVRDVMERLLAAEKRQKKLEEWTENAITGDIIHMTKTTKAEIERAAMIEALRWVTSTMDCENRMFDDVVDAITRLENGGDL